VGGVVAMGDMVGDTLTVGVLYLSGWVFGCFGRRKNRILIWLFGTDGDIGMETSR
jgi:hypothetical protein